MKEGATAYKHVDGVNVEGESVIHGTACNEIAPAYYAKEDHPEKFSELLNYVLELNRLVWAQDVGSALNLGVISNDILKTIFIKHQGDSHYPDDL